MRKQTVIDAMDEMMNINDDMSFGEVKRRQENYDLVLAQLNNAVEEYAVEKYSEKHDNYSYTSFSKLKKLTVEAKIVVEFYIKFYKRWDRIGDSRKISTIKVDLQDVFNDKDSHFVPPETDLRKDLLNSINKWNIVTSYWSGDISYGLLESLAEYLVDEGVVKKDSIPCDKEDSIKNVSQIIRNFVEENYPHARMFKDIRKKEHADSLATYLYYDKFLS